MPSAEGPGWIIHDPIGKLWSHKAKEKPQLALKPFAFIEVPDILISNELLEDMWKLADLYDYFKLTGAGN